MCSQYSNFSLITKNSTRLKFDKTEINMNEIPKFPAFFKILNHFVRVNKTRGNKARISYNFSIFLRIIVKNSLRFISLAHQDK